MYVGTGFNKWGMTSSNLAANIVCDMILGKKNKYSYVFDSTRVHPIKNIGELKNVVVQSVDSLFLDKIKNTTLDFNSIPNDSGGIIKINGKKIGVYKDTTRKYLRC